MAVSELRVAIVGAGIGGLSLALALRERGVHAEVFEQAAELSEIGAAIALSANGTREFARLGVLTKTVVDVGATSGSGVELSDGIHTDHGGRSCLTLMPA